MALTPNAPVHVGILEDHTVIREMLASFLSEVAGFRVLFSTGEPEEAWQACCRRAPDVAIVDLDLGSLSGFSFLERLRSLPTRGLVFTASEDPDNIKRAIQLGAGGFLDKTVCTDTFLQALRMVAAGETFFPPHIVGRIVV